MFQINLFDYQKSLLPFSILEMTSFFLATSAAFERSILVIPFCNSLTFASKAAFDLSGSDCAFVASFCFTVKNGTTFFREELVPPGRL